MSAFLQAEINFHLQIQKRIKVQMQWELFWIHTEVKGLIF